MKKLIGIIIIAATLLATMSCANTDKKVKEVLKLHKEAIELIKENKLSEAETILKKSIELAPDAAFSYYKLGTIYESRGDTDQAISFYEQANKIFPFNTQIVYALGEMYRKKGMHEKAIEKFKLTIQAIDNKEFKYKGHLSLAISLYERGELDIAFMHLRKAIGLKPLNSKTYYYIAKILTSRGNKNAALKEFDRAVALFYLTNDKEYIAKVRKDYSAELIKNGQNERAREILKEDE